MVIVVLRQLHYSRSSQQSSTLRLQCTGVLSQLQDRTLQQSILLPANAELTTTPFASPSLTDFEVYNQQSIAMEMISNVFSLLSNTKIPV
jgi:hypothetical protein